MSPASDSPPPKNTPEADSEAPSSPGSAPGRLAGAPGSGAPASFWAEMGATYRLAWPVMGARFALLGLITCDVVMCGWAGGEQLAYFGAAFAPVQLLYMVGLGWMSGLSAYIARLRGAGRAELCGAAWRAALLHGVVLGGAGVLLASQGTEILRILGQPQTLALEGGKVLFALGLGLPGSFLLLCCGAVLEGLRRPRPVFYTLLGGNAANLLLNWLLMFPPGGEEGLGALGAALATSIVRWGMGLSLLAVVLRQADARHYGLRHSLHPLSAVEREVRLQGIPLSLAQTLEGSAFTTLNLLAGRLGVLPLAAYQIAQNLFALVYMLGVGMGVAASVRVGEAMGARNHAVAKHAAWVAVCALMLLLLPLGALFALFPQGLVQLYTQDASVQALATPLLQACALFVLLDGLQGVWMGVLRGAGDVRIPATMVTLGFWGVSVPLAWWLGVHEGHGLPPFAWGLTAGALAASTMLCARFVRSHR